MQMHYLQLLESVQALKLTPSAEYGIVPAPIQPHLPHIWRSYDNRLSADIYLPPIPDFDSQTF